MGKKLIVQRRGRGTPVFRAAGHKRIEPVKYRKISRTEMTDKIEGEVVSLHHEPGRGAPLARIRFDDGQYKYVIPAEGMAVGSRISYGAASEITPGNVLPLKDLPVRTPVFNLEVRSGDGGKLVRAGGGSAIIDSKTDKWVYVKLSSGKLKALPPEARATVGIVAGGGRTRKPLLKAGNMFHKIRAKGHKYPHVRGTAMNPVSHPHGGGSHQSPPRATTVSRNAPPGRKVGLIAARRTGIKRGRQKVNQ